ncbi:MAG: hypothetical protein LC689_17055 [Myxococcales bacterium]|nr:hypothetical protein [Myxococcales bacterium]
MGAAAFLEVIARLIAVFILTRVIAVGATHLGAAFMTPAKRAQWQWIPGRDNLFPGPPPSPFLAPLVRWDANFYLSIARDGYPPRHGGPNHHLVFLPLYPLLLRSLHVDVFWAAFLVSNLCCLIAALCVFRLAGFEAAALFLCGPGSHFFSYPYSEALFAAALAATLLLLRSRHFLAAGLTGAVASATRSPGVAAAVALFAARSNRAFLAGVLSLGGIAAYMWWCHVAQGDALAFMHLQAYHGRRLSLLGPFRAFFAFDTDPDYYLVAIAAIYVCVRLVRRTPAWQWVTAAFLVVLPLSTGTLAAMIRYQSANVPLICGVPALVQGRRFWIATGLCLALMAFEAFLYGKGIGHF